MALLLSKSALPELRVALPALLQQFVDHDGVLHKAYVIGDQARLLLSQGDNPVIFKVDLSLS